MQNFLKNFLKVVALAIFLFTFAFSVSNVFAGASQNVAGFAWSDNIGWISLNNSSDGSAIDYGVNKNADGTLTGFGWSDNVGWVKFGGLSGFPSGSGTVASNAKLNGANFEGWARACAGMSDPASCTDTITSQVPSQTTITFAQFVASNGQYPHPVAGQPNEYNVYDWTVPENVTSINVQVWGGGGQGGGANPALQGAGGGGGAGGYGTQTLSVTPGEVYVVKVGLGGRVDLTIKAAGNTGGTSSFSRNSLLLNATGGIGGVNATGGAGAAGGQGGTSNLAQAFQGGKGGNGGNAGGCGSSGLGGATAGAAGQNGGLRSGGGGGASYTAGILGGKGGNGRGCLEELGTYESANGKLYGGGGGGGGCYNNAWCAVGSIGGDGSVVITYTPNGVSAPDPRGGWDGWISLKGTSQAPATPPTTATFDYTTTANANGQTSTNGQGYYWDVPAGVTSFAVEMWGAGGKGGNGGPAPIRDLSGSGGGGGGGSGAYGKKTVTIPQGVTRYLITVGGTSQNTTIGTSAGTLLTAGTGANGRDGSNVCVTDCRTGKPWPRGWTDQAPGGTGGLVSPSTGWLSSINGTTGQIGEWGYYDQCGPGGYGWPGVGGNGANSGAGGTGGAGGTRPVCNNPQPGTAGGAPGAGGGGGAGSGTLGGIGGKGRISITYAGTTATAGSPYQVLANNTGTFCVSDSCTNLSWAWGSDILGWIDFSGVTFDSSLPGVTATPTVGACTVDLTYTPYPAATSYQLKRSFASASSGFSNLGPSKSTVSQLQIVDGPIVGGTEVWYKVTATKNGSDIDSPPSSTEVPSNCMPAPTNVVAQTISCSSASTPNGSVTLKWDAVAPATGYDIHDNNLFVKSTGLLQTTISGLVAGSSHSYKVLARDLADNTTVLSSVTPVSVTIPTCLSASCSASPTSIDLASPVPVVWSANVLNGTPPFTYQWFGDSPLAPDTADTNSLRSDSKSVTYTTLGAKQGSISVSDSSNPQQSVSQIQCDVSGTGSVLVTNSDFGLIFAPATATLKFVGQSASSKPVAMSLWTGGETNSVTLLPESPTTITLNGVTYPVSYKFYNHGTTELNSTITSGNSVDMVIVASKQIPKGTYPNAIVIKATSPVKTNTYMVNLNVQVFNPIFQEF